MNDVNKAITILEDLKVKNIIGYDFESSNPFYDYFLIGTVNERQGNAVVNHFKKDEAIKIHNIEGKGGGWILVDLGNIIVHLFKEEERGYYDFDRHFIGVKKIKPEAKKNE